MSGEMTAGDTVRLTVPATTAYVGLLRSLAAGLAARLDLDLDHVEDLRLAMSEACSLVLADSAGTGELSVELTVAADGLVAEVSAPTRLTSAPSRTSFAWTVLSTLADDASAEVSDGVVTVRLRVTGDVDVDRSTEEAEAGRS
jgi:serine/threonine-protein kinase RsbW